MHRIGFRGALLVAALLFLSACVIKPALVQPAETDENAKPLFCAFGGVGGLMPIPRAPGFESEFAVAVVEINSPRKTTHVAGSDFVLFDRAGRAAKLKRVIEIDVFEEHRVATEGLFAYYLNTTSNATRPWEGTLPAGRIRLRVRIALVAAPVDPVRFKLTIGRYVIEGLVDGSWAT